MFSSLVKPYQPSQGDSSLPAVLDVSFERIKSKLSPQEETLDLNRLAVKNPVSTYFMRVPDNSMADIGIYPNDIVIIDKGLKAKAGDIVAVLINGSFAVRGLDYEDSNPVLVPEHSDYEPIRLKNEALVLYGVVRGVYRDIK
jgi:DNA polymerase V